MVKSMVLRELHTLEETTMDKVRFLMSDTGAQITEACREALEQKGVEVTVVEKDGNKVLQKMLAVLPQVLHGNAHAGLGKIQLIGNIDGTHVRAPLAEH